MHAPSSGRGVLERLTAALADRYRIERELGAGGMATVYLAEDLKHKRDSRRRSRIPCATSRSLPLPPR